MQVVENAMFNKDKRIETLQKRMGSLKWDYEPSGVQQFIKFFQERFSLQVEGIALGYDAEDMKLGLSCSTMVDFFTAKEFPKHVRKAAKKVVTYAFQDMDGDDFNAFCKTLHEYNALQPIIEKAHPHLPEHVKDRMEQWYKNNVRTKLSIPAAFQQIKIVEIDGLLPEGDSNPLGIKRFNVGAQANENTAPDQQRLQWILEGLTEDGFTQDQIKIYRDKAADIRSHNGNPYIVVNVKKGAQHFQIAVCEKVGNITYVIRTPIDFEKNPSTTISHLKRDKMVWQESCYDRGQWLNDLRHAAYTPVENLAEQLKTRLAWHDKKDALLQSLKEYYEQTGDVPDKDSNTIIEHGLLKGVATWSRAYGALQRGSISGLKNIHNLKDALISAVPEAATALQTSKPVDARKTFENAVLHIRDTKTLPTIDPAVERAFRKKNVTGLAELTGSDDITSSWAFYMATGLASQNEGGELVPAAPNVIKQLARLIEERKPEI